jgi:adenylate kinase family enzyme
MNTGRSMRTMLGAATPLPRRPRRILVCGVTGSGKSTFAAELAGVLDLPYTEIDALYHGPDWVPRPQFVEEVDRFTAEDGWVTEWQYRVVRERLLDRADLLVWLDYPFRISLARLVRRTLRRRIRREVLWHGNTEPPLRTFFTQPDEHIVRWALATRDKYRERVPQVEEARPDLAIVRLRDPGEATRWLRGLVRGELLPQR